jgi:hypothetical protein
MSQPYLRRLAMIAPSPDRLSLGLKLMLAILGAFLLLVGLYRWFGLAG